MNRFYLNQIIWYLFIGVTFISCNKNSLQLPPADMPQVFSKICNVNNTAKVEVIFRQENNDPEGKIYLSLKNLSGVGLIHLKLLIEMRKDSADTYDNTDRQTVILKDTLKPNSDYFIQLPYNVPDLKLKQNNITAVILSYDDTEGILSASYSTVYSAFEKNHFQTLYYGMTNGYILADGNSLFRLKDSVGNFYTIKGNFVDTTNFINGALYNRNGTIISPLILDTLESSNRHFTITNNNLFFRLKLPTYLLPDSIKSILIHLKKD